MQFLILLTGVLVFVFYHFHPAPVLWNPVELRKLERAADPVELAAVRQRYAAAETARRSAAEAWLASRGPGTLAAYRAASAELGAARGDAVKLVERVNGGARYNDTNYIFPSYILAHLPHGLAGLVIAVIFAAAMSTLSGEFNSLATATMVDFYKRFVSPAAGDARELLVSRVFTAFWGGFACLIALRAGQLGSAIEVVNRFGSYFYGSILGVFLLAVLTPRASARGAFYGLMIGMAAVFGVSRFVPAVHFLWYNVVGALTVFVAGLVITALSADRPPARSAQARTA
jgi:Na+/proline symporter